MIEEDKEAERAKTKEGMPWWAYLIGLILVTGFVVMMMVLPQRAALLTGGLVIYFIALIINIYAWVRVLIIAFSEHVGQGLGCLLCGCYMFVYCIMRWDKCGAYLLMMIGSAVVGNMVGFAFGAVANQMGNGGEARLHNPSAVRCVDEVAWHSSVILKPRNA